MKIIIYGIGNGRIDVERRLKKDHEIVGYSDSFFEGNYFNGKVFYKLKQLCKVDFDIIVIAISKLISSNYVYNKLIENKIDRSKIIDYYAMYYLECRKKQKNIENNMSDVDGIVLGISYAKEGIYTKELEGSVLNLSYASQDLYYNLKKLQKAVLDKKLQKLKYAIIDMWNYNYFNYDLSCTQNAIKYYLSTRIYNEDIHNYKLNKYCTEDIRTQLKKLDIYKMDRSKDELFYNLFKEEDWEHIYNINEKDYSKFKEIYMLKDNEIREYEYNKEYYRSSIEIKRFEHTIKENIEIFDEILKTLVEINNNIKIYILLIPQYNVVEKREKVTFKNWKKEFYEILDDFKCRYKFEILDLKNLEQISSKKEYYRDLYHLNINGAKEFTKLLNKYINMN